MRTLRIWIFIFFVLASLSAISQSNDNFSGDECTIGVASGDATSDGRPMVWKSRDYSSEPNNEVKYNTSFRYKFLSVSNAGSSTYAWMGLNEHGFAIVNALVSDLSKGPSGPSNGALMRDVLGNCKTIAEFRHYLDSTNQTGRTSHANFGVIDSTGEAAIFETSGNNYREYNAKDASNGYIIRTNFSLTGGGSNGIERYDRSKTLVRAFYTGDSLNTKSILRYQMRDFSNFNSQPVSVPYNNTWGPGIPYGYINTSKSICRNSTVSAVVVQGVLPTEPGALSIFWTLLGQPASAIAVPYWPVAEPPAEADGKNTAPLCDVSRQIRSQLFDFSGGDKYINSFKLLDGKGAGLWTCSFPFEDSILRTTSQFMDSIRTLHAVPLKAMQHKEKTLATATLQQLEHCKQSLLLGVENYDELSDFSIFPNPASCYVNVRFKLLSREKVYIALYSLDGRRLAGFLSGFQKPGTFSVRWDISHFPHPGIYFLMVRYGSQAKTIKVLFDYPKKDCAE